MNLCLKTVLLCTVCVFFFSSCFSMSSGGVSGSDEIITKRQPINAPICAVQLSFGGLKIIQIGDEEKEELVVITHKDIYPALQMGLSRDGCLSLGFKDGIVIHGRITLEYELRVKSLRSIKIFGCGHVLCSEEFGTESLKISISGNGSFAMKNLVVPLLDLSISGNGSVTIGKLVGCDKLSEKISGNGKIVFRDGVATQQIATISGNGSIDSSGLVGTLGEVSISGFGSARVNIAETLRVVAPSADMVNNCGRAAIELQEAESQSFGSFSFGGSCVAIGSGSAFATAGRSVVFSAGGSVFVDGRRVV